MLQKTTNRPIEQRTKVLAVQGAVLGAVLGPVMAVLAVLRAVQMLKSVHCTSNLRSLTRLLRHSTCGLTKLPQTSSRCALVILLPTNNKH